ncbi:hypothetical protein [Escherichia phage BI-EHEC]|nr:hypothetical protein [Escherichia phage BI-EHEC]
MDVVIVTTLSISNIFAITTIPLLTSNQVHR